MDKQKYISWFKDIRKEDVPLVGGKGANLGELKSINIPVPDGFVITTEMYKKFIEETGAKKELKKVISDISNNIYTFEQTRKASGMLKKIIREAGMPQGIQKMIINPYQMLCSKEKPIGVAVRSSASEEDMEGASFAGQYETLLNIKNEKSLISAIKECWSSAFGDRVIEYKRTKGIKTDVDEMGVAVVVQCMVNAETAGVMFTLDPRTGDRSKIVVEANWGLGESLVSGTVNPDYYIISKNPVRVIEMKIGEKKVFTAYSKEGVIEKETPIAQRKKPCLTEEKIISLAYLGKQIESHCKTPQDIEWAIEEKKDNSSGLYILQARCETVWSQKKEPKDNKEPISKIAAQFKGFKF